METTGENLFQVKKERSYISCLVNGCSYGFRHLGLLFRYIWPGLLLTAVFPLPFVFLFAAQNDAVLRKWTELGYLPRMTVKSMRSEIGQCANRSAISVLIDISMLCFVIAGFSLLAMSVFYGISYWWGIIVLLSAFFLFIPLNVVEMQISFSNLPIVECFSCGYGIAFRNYGKLFAFSFLYELLGGLIAALGTIPFQVLLAAGMQGYMGWKMGDGWNLPLLFPLYFLLAVWIMYVVILTVSLVFSFSRCLMWGSLVNEVPAQAEADR